MKKTLIALVAVLAAAGAHAQVTVTGQLHTMFHLSLQNGSRSHAQAFEVTEPQWHFSFLHGQTFFSVNAEFEGAAGFLSFAGDGGWEAGGWRRLREVYLSGNPVAHWIITAFFRRFVNARQGLAG